jgi:hypothetical protein
MVKSLALKGRAYVRAILQRSVIRQQVVKAVSQGKNVAAELQYFGSAKVHHSQSKALRLTQEVLAHPTHSAVSTQALTPAQKNSLVPHRLSEPQR